MKRNSVLIFGYGYLGSRVGQLMLADGWDVFAVTRSAEKAQQMTGVTPIVANWNRRTSLRELPKVDRVLVSVGWDRTRGSSQHDVYVEGLRNAIRAINADANIAYVSSTGVYHQTGGVWVDERSPCHPKLHSGGWSHLRAEELLRRSWIEGQWSILRMAGLYGPDRVPRARDILTGSPLSLPTKGFLNLIHIDDAAMCVKNAWEGGLSRQTYAISDGNPVNRRTYYEEIAQVVGAPAPQFVEANPDAPVGRRAATSKRIWTAKMRRELTARLMYPDYRSGLAAILNPS